MIILIPIVLNVIIIMVTYSDVRDLRFLKASAAMERISLLLRSLKYFSNDDDDDGDTLMMMRRRRRNHRIVLYVE